MQHLTHPDHSAADPRSIVQRAVPNKLDIQVVEVLPRVAEGGAFIKFTYAPKGDAKTVESNVREYLKSNPIKPWFNPFERVRTSLVLGRPWIEDLHRRPNPRVKVEFVPTTPGQSAEELSQETLYSLFRRYGKLADIESQPTDSKELPKYAFLNFSKWRNAIMAKNCMHGYVVPASEGGGEQGTRLKILYEQKRKGHWIWGWLVNHPRFVIPALLAFVGTVTVAVFDPIRTFFIKAHVTRTFHIKDNTLYKWLSSQASKATDVLSLKHHRTEDAGLTAIWEDRKDDIAQIQTWLMESADTFIIVQGPRGTNFRTS